jgi:glycosyltransferase involved in cell wall biosynthesis/2-polyprenyl-3-methyl-5-hydroxy-6-metoxy-1,4-benzoquinol methylase
VRGIRTYLTGGDGVGWALDNDLLLLRQALRDIVAEVPPETAEVIHSVWWEGLPALHDSSRGVRKILCHMSGEPWRYFSLPAFRHVSPCVDLWIAQSRQAEQELASAGMRSCFVPYTVDDKHFRPIKRDDPALEAIRQRWSIPDGAYLIGNFHRDSEGADVSSPKLVKGPDMFVEVVDALRKSGHPVHVLIAGPRRHWLRASLKHRGIPFTFVGEQIAGDDLQQNRLDHETLNLLYNLLHLTLITSRSEGGPRSILEASAASCAVLSTPVGHAEDILEPAAIESDFTALVQAIDQDIRHGALRTTVDVHRARVMERHTVGAVAPLWRSVYASIAPELSNENRSSVRAHALAPLPTVSRQTPRVGIWHSFMKPPYGGGNQFMLALTKELRRRGVEVVENAFRDDIDVYLLNAIHFDVDQFIRFQAQRAAPVVHRIDGPIQLVRGFDQEKDALTYDLNKRYAHTTILQSAWTLRNIVKLGYQPVRPLIIRNAVDPDIFHPSGRGLFDGHRRVRLISSSWSDNPNKGGPTYRWLDEHLPWDRFEYTFAGRSSEPFRHIARRDALPSEELAQLLRDHDIYITASKNDPCSNAVIEALACGLPVVYLHDGGHPELVGMGGLPFGRPEEIPDQLDKIVSDYAAYQSLIRTDRLSEVGDRYLQVLKEAAADRPRATVPGSTLSLALFFTRGMSLKEWARVGMLGREMALYQRLQAFGVEVTMVTYGGEDDPEYARDYPGIRVLSNAVGLPPEEYENAIERIHAASLRGIDVFKTNQTNGSDIALRVAKHFGRPLIARCGYMWSTFAQLGEGNNSPTAHQALVIEQEVFTQADRVVVTTEAMRNDLMIRLPEIRDRVAVIPNYVDTHQFAPGDRLPHRWDLLFIGRLVPQKNVLALLDAVLPLSVRLGIIGQGPLEGSLKKHPASVQGKIEWLGAVPSGELVHFLQQTRIFVLPSLYEGHPKTLLEAMSTGVACIGTEVPGIMGVLEHRKNGLLCPPTAEGIRQAIQRFLADEQLAAQLGARARQDIIATCDLDRIAEQELRMLRDLHSTVRRTVAEQQTENNDTAFLDRLTDRECADRIGAYLAERARKGDPADGLRLLFRVEDVLYSAEGGLSTRYGNGVHTKHRHTRYHDFFVNRVRKGETVLDVGCGNGAVAYDLAERSGANVIGIDLSEQNIASAQKMHNHPNVRYVAGDALRLTATGQIDVVVLSNVLEHMTGRPGFLRTLVALCNPSRLLIRVPMFERDWRVPLRRELGVEHRLDSTHETEYTLESFAAELAEAGLRATHQEVRWGEVWAECVPLGEPPAPRLSVIMSTHNDARFLPLAMESILQQTYRDFECIIVDDASTDESARILRRYTDPRVRILHHDQNIGLTRSLNEALTHCHGTYVARMDGDDIALPDRFMKQVTFLDEHPGVGMVGTAFMYIDADNTVTGWEPVYVTDEEIRSRLLKQNCFGHGTVMARRALLQDLGGYDESFKFSQDYDLWLRIAERASVANLADKLYCWRRTQDSISTRNKEEQEASACRARQCAIARGILKPAEPEQMNLAPGSPT